MKTDSVKEIQVSYQSGNTDHWTKTFRKIILEHYRENRRDFPWRNNPSPWEVYVSEVMLQQTQTNRVSEMFPPFMERFPSPEVMAASSLEDVLRHWKGLGYNRRARSLHQASKVMVENHGGTVPQDPEQLVELPGIGPATAASIAAFAFDRPTVFVETNIRTVYIYFFFPGQEEVHDRDILPLVESTLDRKSPHHWYSALMDYGAMLKKNLPNPGRKSRHHVKQSPFKGSRREIRSRIMDLVLEQRQVSRHMALENITSPQHDVNAVIDELVGEGFLSEQAGKLVIP